MTLGNKIDRVTADCHSDLKIKIEESIDFYGESYEIHQIDYSLGRCSGSFCSAFILYKRIKE